MTRAAGIGTALLTYFQERPGQVVTVDQLMKHFNLDRTQVQGNMYNLRKKEVGKDIELLQQGMWRLNVNTTKDKELRQPPSGRFPDGTMTFEILKVSEDKKHMVGMTEGGDVYKITHLA